MRPILNIIYKGDSLKVLKTWPNDFVQCVVTSPPYWGLRDYGMTGQIGLESTLEEYVANMVEVFREIRRVLRKDGTLWLNLGDSYASAWSCSRQNLMNNGPATIEQRQRRLPRETGRWGGGNNYARGLKEKDLCGIPWRVAFALQADGWFLRSDIIWAKPNPMPESVMDRPTKAHEYLFLLTKSERYFYNSAAIRTPTKDAVDDARRLAAVDFLDKSHPTEQRNGLRWRKMLDGGREKGKQRGHSRRHDGFNERWDKMTKEAQTALGANARTVWSIATQPFPEAHFATFPPEIPRRCIATGSRTGGGDVILDPFMGAGTTAVVAKRLKRSWLGIELNPKYIEIAERRISREPEALLSE